MATYFFSPNGHDNHSGSQGSPFRTLSKGLHTIHAGDTLFGRGGTYNERVDSNEYPHSSFPCGDSFSNPVTIAGFQNEPVIITGGMNFPHPYIHHVIFDHLIIDGTHVKDAAISSPSDGAHDMRFQHGEVRNAGQGFPVQPPGRNFPCIILGEKWEFLHNDIHGSRYSFGFYIAADDCLIEGNNIYDNGGHGIQIFDGQGIASRNHVRNNHIHRNGLRNPRGQRGGIVLARANDTWIYNNFIYNNDGEAGIMVNASGSNTKIYHNNICNNKGKGLYIKLDSDGTVCRNNIVYQNAGEPIDNQGNSTITNNLTANPNFADPTKGDFTLRLGSPAINAGFNLTGVIDVDAMGTPRPQNGTYDIGAMEFTGRLCS